MFRCIYDINTAGNFALAEMGFPRETLIYVQSKKLCRFYMFKFLIVNKERTLIG